MTSHIRTSDQDETLLEAMRAQLATEGITVHKWHVLRLALGISIRFPDAAVAPPSARTTEYDLQQVTGVGKGGDADITPALEMLLSDSDGASTPFHRRLEDEVARGFQIIRTDWVRGDSLWEYLAKVFVPGLAPVEPPVPLSALARVLRPLRLTLHADPIAGPRFTVYSAIGGTQALSAAVVAREVRSAIAPNRVVDVWLEKTDCRIAVERAAITWRPVTAEQMRAAPTPVFAVDAVGEPVALPAQTTMVVGSAPASSRAKLCVLRALEASTEGGSLLVVADHTSSFWSIAVGPHVRRALPEDPRLTSRSNRPTVLVLDGPETLAAASRWGGVPIIRLVTEDAPTAQIRKSEARVFLGSAVRHSVPNVEAATALDWGATRTRDACLAVAPKGAVVYYRIHLMDRASR